MSARPFRLAILLALLPLLAAAPGCSLFIGNVKPVEDKADNYRVLDLSRVDPDWERLDSQSDPSRTDVSDLAFQSRATASIISLNSACRASWESEEPRLAELMRQLLLGFNERNLIEEKEVKIDGQPALQTTLDGKLQNDQVRLRAIVARKDSCVYDLMYISRPESFASQEKAFHRFVESLRLR